MLRITSKFLSERINNKVYPGYKPEIFNSKAYVEFKKVDRVFFSKIISIWKN